MTAVPTPRFRPVIPHSVPALVIRLIVAAVILGLSFAIIGWQPLLALAFLLGLATLVFPRAPAAWALGALLAFESLGPLGSGPSWKFFAALAGAHLLHVIGVTLPWLPFEGPVQLRIFARTLRIFLIIQIPAQLISYLVLTVLAGRSAVAALTSPAFGLVTAIGFVLLIGVIVAPMVRANRSAG